MCCVDRLSWQSLADILRCNRHVRFTPQKRTLIGVTRMSALCQKRTSTLLFDKLRSALLKLQGHFEPDCLCSLQVDHEFEFVGLKNG